MIDDIQDQKLHEAVAALPREIQPARDLWPGIAARIAPRRGWLQPWPAAAAVAGLIVIGAIAAAVSLHHSNAPATFAVQPVTRPQPPATAAVPNARAEAIATAIRRSTRLAPETQAVLLKNLDITETSIADIQRTMHENPDAPGLQPLLYQQYRNEATLVTAAQRVQLQNTTGVIAP